MYLDMVQHYKKRKFNPYLACEYIKQHASIDNLLFKSDIGGQAIEW